MASNEIPDSFIFDKCVTFHVDDDNLDDMPSYKDIWSRVLQKEYLEILTDFEESQKVIRNIDMFSEWGHAAQQTSNMTFLFDKHNVDPKNYEVFKLYMLQQEKDFEEKLNKQKAETRKKLEEERAKREAEEERLRQQMLAEVKEENDDDGDKG